MVTIDGVIRNVGEFEGNLETGQEDYEIAKQGLELIKSEMDILEDRLKLKTGFDKLDLPEEPTSTEVRRGDVNFEVKSHTRTKKPQYKTAVTEMENYLNGISFLLSQGRTITGIVKEGRSTYIAVDKLLEAYELITGGIMIPEVKHTIRYELEGVLSNELETDGVLEEITLRDGRNSAALTEENFANYARMDHIKEDLSTYVKAYEKELAKGQRTGGEKTTAVTSKAAYKTKKSTSNGVDWAYVVSTLITVPTKPDDVGEMNTLADMDISKAEKERQMPEYQLMYKDVRGSKKLYVSTQSVYMRIQELKGDQTIQAKRLIVMPREIV